LDPRATLVRLPKLKAVPERKIEEKVPEIEAMMVSAEDQHQQYKTNALMYAGARIVTERLNVKPKRQHIQREPSWTKEARKTNQGTQGQY